MIRRAGMFVAALACAGAVAANVVQTPEAKIEPGHHPEIGTDERSLWMEMDEAEERLKRSPMLIRDKSLNRFVADVCCRVAGPYCPDIRVYLVRNPAFNASMAPNGMMQVWSGLLLRVRSEDELASVLGHEIAHYTRTDSLERLRRVKKTLAAGSVFSLGLGILTGVYSSVGQDLAVLDALAFSREQESNADLLGATMMARAGFDPRASYQVWEMLMDEEKAAVAKAEEPSPFLRTHPQSGDRAETLKKFVAQMAPSSPARKGPDPFIALMSDYYVRFMEDQLDTNRFGRTEAILNNHEKKGVDPILIAFFRGEMYRQRGNVGDLELAMKSYERATQGERPYPEAHRNLGYLLLKQDKRQEALRHFTRYLELKPAASDRSMIEFYLEE